MNTKTFLLFFVSVLLITSFVAAKDIAYIARDSNNPNSKIVSILNNKGYSYDIIDDSQISAVNFTNYRMILVWDEIIANSTLVPVGTVNALVGNMHYLDDWKIANSPSSTIIGNNYEYAKIIDSTSNIVEGITATPIKLYTQTNIQLFSLPFPFDRAKGIKSIVARDDRDAKPLIATIDVNGLLLDNSKSKSRILIFTITETKYWTTDTQLLFENSLLWTLSGSDRDGDGFYYDVDCNDDDAGIWQNIPGYIDSDEDGFGTGSLLQVCSGGELDIGYANNSLDCNDNNTDVWQNIPGYIDHDEDSFGFGSLLQVCSGDELSLGYINNSLDCNDSNGSIWQNIPGYIDEDGDGFGTGSLLQVCSGDELHVGYIDNNLDCNDNNHVVNPSEEEIAYDELDNDCKNGDLKDVDLDGYDSTIVGGTDCNDNNADVWQNIPGYIDEDGDGFGTGSLLQVCSAQNLSLGYVADNLDCDDSDETVNPNATEIMDSIDQNCVNEAPIINPIGDVIIANEGETITFDVIAEDYEGDDLIYGINSSQFQADDNRFTWVTNFNDAGNYTFKISVRDNQNITTTNIAVMILNKNIVPLCDDIPDVIWDEDGNATLNLNDYCHDTDGGFIGFGVNDTSTDSHIIIKKLIHGNAEFESVKDWNGEDWITFNVFDSTDMIVTEKINLIVNPINDEPTLINSIENISLSEDTNQTNKINLNDYFKDVDSNLTFSVTGNDDNLKIVINNNGSVSFYPVKDFFGEERIVFSASDDEFDVNSNEVVMNVIDTNEPPEFGEMNCQLDILEDNRDYNCTLDASDFEGDNITFSIIEDDGIVCSLSNKSEDLWCNGADINRDGFVDSSDYSIWRKNNNCTASSNESCGNSDANNNGIVDNEDYDLWRANFGMDNCSGISQVPENIKNNLLTYSSEKDYAGSASCLIRVSDATGYDDFLFSVNVINTNDGPLITDFLPKGLVRLLAGRNETFKVDVNDIDNNNINYKWHLNEENLEENDSTLTTKFDNTGLYNLSCTVSDGEFEATQQWEVFVGNTSEFICTEVGGNICNDNQLCNGNFIPVKDTNMCCSIACSQKPPAFSDIDNRNQTKNSGIQIDIIEPDSNKKINVNEETRIRIDVRNNLPQDAEFELSAYIYDITEDRVIEEFNSDTTNIDKNSRELFVFDSVIPEDINEGDEFYIFAKVDAEDSDNIKYYNEYYRSLDIARDEKDVIIDNIEIEQPEELLCGDSFNLKFNVKNIGTTNQNVVVKIENSALKINQEISQFLIERYGKEDQEKKELSFTVPEKTSAGEYSIKIKATYNGETKSYEKSIVTGKCPEEKVKIEKVNDKPGIISLKSSNALEENTDDNVENFDTSVDKRIVALLLSVFLISVAVLFYLWFF